MMVTMVLSHSAASPLHGIQSYNIHRKQTHAFREETNRITMALELQKSLDLVMSKQRSNPSDTGKFVTESTPTSTVCTLKEKVDAAFVL
mmetsp:Transcript_29332/g.44397  ORF Transcript_29332/g.44397 Transcript_29332/m.44397 type:complete len:89 (+) Transcript_29332:707-973(+)